MGVSPFRSNVNFWNFDGALPAYWSFPLHRQLKGYVQTFTGESESLIDHKHYKSFLIRVLPLSSQDPSTGVCDSFISCISSHSPRKTPWFYGLSISEITFYTFRPWKSYSLLFESVSRWPITNRMRSALFLS